MKEIWDYIEEQIGKGYFQSLSKYILLAIATPVIFILIVLFIFIGNWETNMKPVRKMLNSNAINVTSGSPGISSDSVRIDWNIPYVKPVTVYKNGRQIRTDFHEYGDNFFTLYYGDSLIARVVHYKKSAISGHDYQFTVNDSASRIKASLKIKGEYDSIRWIE